VKRQVTGGHWKLERNRENKEDFILKEAAKLFRHKGYGTTTMDEIADAVGLTKATIYHYFEGKEEIQHKIAKPALEMGVDLLRKIVESDRTPKEKFVKAVHNHFELMDQYYPNFFGISDQDLNCVSSQMREEIFRLMYQYEQLWREIIIQGVSAGQFRADQNTKLTSYAILGMFNWTLKWYRKGGALSTAQIAEQNISLISRGLDVNSAIDIPSETLCEVSKSKSSATKDCIENAT
jgi:TetR/AcrR family transcriptional regulator, cholesterol catabolism regulator